MHNCAALSSSSFALSPLLRRRNPPPLSAQFPAKILAPPPSIPFSAPSSLLSRRSPPPYLSAMPSSTAANQSLLVFETEDQLAAALAKHTAELSAKFVKERGAFTVVISGGSLVKSLRKLSEDRYLETVDWGKWHVFWVDERVVPKNHKDSNYLLACNEFLSKVPIPTCQVYAINDTLSAEDAAKDYETTLKHLVNTGILSLAKSGYPKFDLMLLGMGPDGHIASLFPGHPLLNERERWVTFVKDSPKPPPERITFTLPIINSSAYVAMVVTGAGKAGAVHKTLGTEKTLSDLLPVGMVSLEDGELTWFTDKAAVSML